MARSPSEDKDNHEGPAHTELLNCCQAVLLVSSWEGFDEVSRQVALHLTAGYKVPVSHLPPAVLCAECLVVSSSACERELQVGPGLQKAMCWLLGLQRVVETLILYRLNLTSSNNDVPNWLCWSRAQHRRALLLRFVLHAASL